MNMSKISSQLQLIVLHIHDIKLMHNIRKYLVSILNGSAYIAQAANGADGASGATSLSQTCIP